MEQAILARMLAPMARRMRLMVGRAIVTAINDAGKVQSAQVKLLDGEVRNGVEILHQYGFNSNSPGHPEGLYFSVGADRDHGVMVCVASRQYRIRSLASGEVAIGDDLGQKVHLTRDGIVIDGAGLPLIIQNVPTATIKADTKVCVDAPRLECTGEIIDHCDAGGKSMADMRATYDGHSHHENDVGGETSAPTQAMS